MADNFDRDTHDHDLTYENEQSTVTIPLNSKDTQGVQKSR